MKKEKGFTLIELLVVISIIALLMSILMPALGIARKKAGAVVCMTNMKSLSLGWFMYQADNKGKIMSSKMDGYEGDPGWINTPYSKDGGTLSVVSSTEVTDQDEINGIVDGALYPYLEDTGVFNCPSDKVRSRYDKSEKFVTVAIPNCLNGIKMNDEPKIKKFGSIRRPSEKYNFVETAEERNWIIYGHFVLGAPEYDNWQGDWGWWGPLAVNHIKSSTLGFCDGHAINKKWKDDFTLERVKKLSTQTSDSYGVEVPPANEKEDIEFMAKGWPLEYKGR